LILLLYTVRMNQMETASESAESEKDWQKTQYANLIRYVPSGTYYARLRVKGKLIRRSLKTDLISVAKLRLGDLERHEREAAERQQETSRGKMTFGEALAMFKAQTEASHLLKPASKKYRGEILEAMVKSWPGIEALDIRKIGEADCKTWALRFGNSYSPSRYNSALGILKAIFQVGVENGSLYRNPAVGLKRARVRQKVLVLPSFEQFEKFVKELENGGGRDSRNCADLVRFLAFGGFRKSEAANITWADCDFEKKEITVRGDPETGTKNWTIRRVPMVPDMHQLLERLKSERPEAKAGDVVMNVRECQKAMDRAASIVGMARITHHDLRHLFATLCIESGVDIPTVSRWLGHKDGGALAMKVYGHLRDQHSVAMAQKVTFKRNEPAAVTT
jgi:integrase